MVVLNPETTAKALMAGGNGILSIDETPIALTKRFDSQGIVSTEDSRMAYRELVCTTPGIGQFLSGVILQDEAIHQPTSTGVALADLLSREGIIPGIRADRDMIPLAGANEETVTEGLDGLRERLRDYVQIVAVDVLMEGSHSIEHREQVTGWVVQSVFHERYHQRAGLEGVLLSSGMVVAAKLCPQPRFDTGRERQKTTMSHKGIDGPRKMRQAGATGAYTESMENLLAA
jgi:fructose-bisphosphate aldolase class I